MTSHPQSLRMYRKENNIEHAQQPALEVQLRLTKTGEDNNTFLSFNFDRGKDMGGPNKKKFEKEQSNLWKIFHIFHDFNLEITTAQRVFEVTIPRLILKVMRVKAANWNRTRWLQLRLLDILRIPQLGKFYFRFMIRLHRLGNLQWKLRWNLAICNVCQTVHLCTIYVV